MEAVGQLAGGIAHHFNNLHTVIQGNLSLCEDLVREPEARQLLNDVVSASHRAVSLTRSLLSFSRQQVLRPQAVDLTELILHMRPRLARTLAPGTELVTELAPNLPRIHADPDSLAWILQQLVSNARDAMPQGGCCALRTEVMLGEPKAPRSGASGQNRSFVRVTVSDTGVGMPASVLERLFEPFFSTKELGQGNGLALAAVHGIVEQLEGCIEAASRVGEGSEFRIWLPAAQGRTSAKADGESP